MICIVKRVTEKNAVILFFCLFHKLRIFPQTLFQQDLFVILRLVLRTFDRGFPVAGSEGAAAAQAAFFAELLRHLCLFGFQVHVFSVFLAFLTEK